MASKFSKKKKQADGGEDEWLTTYADSITLLLCFFVILLSVSEPNMDKFEAVTEGFASGFVQDMIELPFKTIYEDFQLIIEDNAVELQVAAEYTDEGVRLDISSSTLFESNSAQLRKEAAPLLQQMALSILETTLEDYRVEIEGHTDDVPIRGSNIYPTNWELSAVRAARVARFVIDQGVEPNRVKATAFSDTQPKVPNLDASGNPIPENRELNRRVIIHFMRVIE